MISLREDDDGIWQTSAVLPEWSGYQSRLGPYGSKDGAGVSDGTVRIGLAPDGRRDGPVTPDEQAYLRWFMENHAEQASALVSALFAALPTLRSDYISAWMLPEDDQSFPMIESMEDLRNVIGLHDVHIHGLAKDGIPFVGYEFGCDWEEEHGLGVLMLGKQVLEIGHADSSFTRWIAKRASVKVA